jgi:hypothetical protein
MRKQTTDGTIIQGTGRWIPIHCAPAVTSRSALYEYGEDNGDGTRLAHYFNHYGHRFALGEFIRNGGPWGPPVPLMWEEADGLHHLAGVQANRWDHPLLVELSDCGEAVRVWQEVDQ